MAKRRTIICGVYQIKNKVNGLIYIGSSNNIYKRWDAHRYNLNKNKHSNMFLQKAWNEYGEKNFEFSILEECKQNKQYEVEQKYLDKYRPYYRNGKGYNISENAERQNSDGIRIFRNRFRRYNPFYGTSKCAKKTMLKEFRQKYCDGWLNPKDEKYLFMDEDDIDTDSIYDWYDLDCDECVVTLNGKSRIFSQMEIDNMARDEIESMFWALDTYDEIAADQRIYGDPDEW